VLPRLDSEASEQATPARGSVSDRAVGHHHHRRRPDV